MNWLIGLFSRRKLYRELSEEIQAHLEEKTEELVKGGLSPEQALLSARREFGNLPLAEQDGREVWRWPPVENLLVDLRQAGRALYHSPGFTGVAILTLALGTGATTTIFSVVNSVLLRPLPYQNQDRLLRVEETHPGAAGTGLTFATFLDLEREAQSMENAAALREWTFNVTGRSEPQQIPGALVSGNFFAAFGSRPLLGRVLQPSDDQPGGDARVVVLSYPLWKSQFGADRGILGQHLQINAESFTVLGVMPPGFAFPQNAQLWCPLVPGGGLHSNRRAHLLTVLADRKPGSSLGRAQGELTAFAENVEKRDPGVDDPSLKLSAVPLGKSLVAPVRPALLFLFLAVALLLLIAGANLASLLLSRATARRKELALRLALGATRARLALWQLSESLWVSVLAGWLGLLFAQAGIAWIRTQENQDLPRFSEISLDWRVFAFASAVSILSGLLFGLAPALAAVKLDLNAPLKQGHWDLPGGRWRGSSATFTVAQFGLATILLAGAGLLGSSLLRVLREAPGFNPDHLLTLQLFLSPKNYPEGQSSSSLVLHEMLERVRRLPGVRSAGVVNALPITGGPSTGFVIEGRPAPRLGDEPEADIRVADPGYFAAMEIPLRSGRFFTDHDTAGSARAVLINETLARTFWSGKSPIGERITMKDWGPPLTGEIVGVVGDVRASGLDVAPGPMLYWSYTQFGQIFNSMVVRTGPEPLNLAGRIKAGIWSVDKDQPISQIRSMEQILSDSVARRRLYLVLLGLFALVALALAGAGIYGVVSQSVARRTREIAIRVAVGAERSDVLWLVIFQAARLALLGVAAGFVLSLGFTRLMVSFLYGVSPADPVTLLFSALPLAAVSLMACYLPARHALGVDPLTALKSE